MTNQVGRAGQSGTDANKELALDVYRQMLTETRPPFIQSAWIEHLPFAYVLVHILKPQALVELGVHMGMSFFAFCQKVQEDQLPTRCYGVDTWQGDAHTGAYDRTIYEDVRRTLEHYGYNRFAEQMRMTFEEAAAKLPDGSIDLIHIDGLHTYDAVRHDFETWLPKASDRAVMLFHDVEVRAGDFGVWKFWEEVAGKYLSFRFPHGNGLGVLGVGKNLSPETRALIDLLDTSPELVRHFATVGKSLGRYVDLQTDHTAIRGEFLVGFANAIKERPWLFKPLRAAAKLFLPARVRRQDA